MRLGVGPWQQSHSLRGWYMSRHRVNGALGPCGSPAGINIEQEWEMEKWDCFDLLCCDSLPYNNFGVIHDTSGPWTMPGHTRAGGGGACVLKF